MKVLSLFSGIGGLDLAAEWAGMEVVAFCEIEPYAVKVLERRWPNVPIFGDVCTLTADSLIERGIRPEEIDVVTGGFPCQDVSTSGKRAGFHDSQGQVTRSGLWGEMYRVISEVKPRWVVAENVWGLLSIPSADGLPGGGFGIVLRDLAELGYVTGWCCYGAYCVGAIHKRRRVFIVAHSPSKRRRCVAQDKQKRFPLFNLENSKKWASGKGTLPFDFMGMFNQPVRGVIRNDDGLSKGMDRLRCLGNSVVPQQAYPIFKAIMEVEDGDE